MADWEAASATETNWDKAPAQENNFHATDGEPTSGDHGGSETCRTCGEIGHFARECPQKPSGGGGGCFNCGEDGHSKAECTSPRVFTGTCRICSQQGHLAAECPEKPVEICKNCKAEGHKLADCKENRAIDYSTVETMEPEKAWENLAKADSSRDLDDIRDAIKVYLKSIPDTTYLQLERAFRHNKFNTHLIAYEKELDDTWTLMDFQGVMGRKYHVGYHFSTKHQRGTMKEAWPATAEENEMRLKDCGVPVSKGLSKCSNCSQLGHISKFCTEDRVERSDKVEIKCVNCDGVGHRARDCAAARVDKFACRNCKQPGHTSAECTEPRDCSTVECKHCGEMGHFVKDCPTREKRTCRNCESEEHMFKECDQPRNPASMTCRNCDEVGHLSKECPKPRDYTRVKCSNCDQMGHTKIRCKAPPKEEEDGAFEAHGGGNTQKTSEIYGIEGAPTALDVAANDGW